MSHLCQSKRCARRDFCGVFANNPLKSIRLSALSPQSVCTSVVSCKYVAKPSGLVLVNGRALHSNMLQRTWGDPSCVDRKPG
eukprot:564936-Amphidinium_carterae.1